MTIAPPSATASMPADDADGAVIVRVIKQAAPPVFITGKTSFEILGIREEEFPRVLRSLGVSYARVRGETIAELALVTAALRERAKRKPGPRPRTATKSGETSADAGALLRRAGFRRAAT